MTKPIPPLEHIVEKISLKAIQTNDCGGLRVVTLYWGETEDKDDTLRYELTPEAAKVYRFREGVPVAGKDDRGKKFMRHFFVKREGDDAIVIRLKKDSPEFPPIDVLLLLETIAKPVTQVDFDPTYGSGGGPRR